MTAPTEQEIREAVVRRLEDWPNDNPMAPLRDAIKGMTSMLEVYIPDSRDSAETIRELSGAEPDPDDLWWNLRPTEAARLNAIREEVCKQAAHHAVVANTSAIVAGALRFAAEYPDAPRAKVPVEA